MSKNHQPNNVPVSSLPKPPELETRLHTALSNIPPESKDLVARVQAARESIGHDFGWENATILTMIHVAELAATDFKAAVDYVKEWENKAARKKASAAGSAVKEIPNADSALLTNLPPTPENLAARLKAARDVISYGSQREQRTRQLMEDIAKQAETDLNAALAYVVDLEDKARKKFKARRFAKDCGPGLEL